MDKILHGDIGQISQSALKKATEPCKYEVFDPNISDDDNAEDNKKQKSIFDKMQIINGVQANDVFQKKLTPIILSATKGIHEKFNCQSAKCPNEHKKNINLEQIDEFFTFKKNVPIEEEYITNDDIQQVLQMNSGQNIPNESLAKKEVTQQQQQISEDCNKNTKKKKIEILSWEEFQHPYKHLIFAKNFEEGKFKRHLSLAYRGVIYSKRCLKSPSEKFINNRAVKLIEPESQNLNQINFIKMLVKRMKTLFLDLDETLIHTTQQLKAAEFLVPLINDQGDEMILGVNVRPYCLMFLKAMSEFFEIYIFTASSFNYAVAISKLLDPKEKYISGILSRENCMTTKNGFFIKDLRVIKNRQMSQMIIVDNLVHSFGFQLENGIPIVEWIGQKKDQELEGLKDYLTSLAFVDDVRINNDKFMKISQMDEFTQEFLGI